MPKLTASKVKSALPDLFKKKFKGSFKKKLKNKPHGKLQDKPKQDAEETVEQAQVKQTANITEQLLTKRYTDVGEKVLRGVHPKSHGCVIANFEINKDIPKHLQVGLFSTPAKNYQAKIRFSNATALVTDDVTVDGDGQISNNSRGMAVKVFGVEKNGKLLERDGKDHNQDFLMINSPSFAFANIPDYLRLNESLIENDDVPDAFFAPLVDGIEGFSDEEKATTSISANLITAIAQTQVENPLEVAYFGAAPFAFGKDRVMHFSVVPCKAPSEQTVTNTSPNYLNEALTETLSKPDDIEFDFVVQVRDRNEADLSIENAQEHWDSKLYPFIKVAKITIPSPQININSPENIAMCEALVFTPWHALKAHEPLGGINRLRKKVYQTSAAVRGGCPHHA